MKTLRIGTQLTFQDHPKDNISDYLRAGLQLHKEIGFDVADFSTTLLDLASDAWKPATEQVLVDAAEIGMPLAVCHLPFVKGGDPRPDAFWEEFRVRMLHAIEAAAILHVECAVIHTNTGTLVMKDYREAEQLDWVLRHIEPFAEHAARLGVPLAVENMPVVPGARVTHRFSQSAEEICRVADTFDMGICWDFGHANVSGVRPSEAIPYIGSRLKMVHVHDNCAMADEHNLPFTGTVDWKDAMGALAAVGFEGVFDLEVSPVRLPGPVRKAYAGLALETARHLMTYLK